MLGQFGRITGGLEGSKLRNAFSGIGGGGCRWCTEVSIADDFIERKVTTKEEAKANSLNGQKFQRLKANRKECETFPSKHRMDHFYYRPFRLRKESTMFPRKMKRAVRETVKSEGFRVVELKKLPQSERTVKQRNMSTVEEETPVPVYTGYTPSLHAVNLSPLTFAANLRVLNELRLIRPKFKPFNLLDFGTGVGSATLATAAVFNKGKWTRDRRYKIEGSRGTFTEDQQFMMAEHGWYRGTHLHTSPIFLDPSLLSPPWARTSSLHFPHVLTPVHVLSRFVALSPQRRRSHKLPPTPTNGPHLLPPPQGMSLKQVTCIERSDGMANIGEKILEDIFTDTNKRRQDRVKHLEIKWLRGLRDLSENDEFDIVVVSKTLEEIGEETFPSFPQPKKQ